MGPTPRPYQQDGIDKAIDFFRDERVEHAIEVWPTGAGKSVGVANIAAALDSNTIVFQPSKEILEQNVQKYLSYGYRAGVYSASAGLKHLDQVTFATIGSVARKKHLFRQFRNIIMDECHYLNSEAGQYYDFIRSLSGCKVLGLTATPYRLTSEEGGSMLTFLTRSKPRIFSRMLYYIQNDVLFNNGYLAPLEYFNFDIVDRTMLRMNSSGSDFDPASVRSYYRQINMPARIIHYAKKILKQRDNLLIFCSLLEEAREVAKGIPGAVVISGDTEPGLRSKILGQFKAGVIPCVINVGVLVVGFDMPTLQAVLIGKSTMSLAWYYQVIGRVMRPFTYPDGSKKTGWVVDLGGNIKKFGKIETMRIEEREPGLFSIWNNGRPLTGIAFSKS